MKKPEILVVEDSDDDYYAFVRACRGISHEIELRRCCTGSEALEYLIDLAHKKQPRPALVFLDLNMPGLDGRDVLREIKYSDELSSLRVVVYSTSDSPADVEFCYANHANAYHVKPMDFARMKTDLKAIIDYWLTMATELSP
ncbi:response regulator [Pseudenhygromyxa sp. WMMC2535]|uniref:response regulator n=1 Tax=Pseudenhygromyxa sp. WMMC2535 TaxID=2712867 RepID=UPI0015539E87|nr:response regulator [Pseudenhygromyxa sp. WMMC2535]NVB43026.1 response regulator [Pseudenhygromyxa sp. WMMC2535]